MKNTKKKIPIIGIIWKTVFNTFKNHPVLLAPFCISGALKLLGLLVIFLSIFEPLSIVFAPIIKTLWGEAFLHYPFNFGLMPRLFYYVQMAGYIFIDGLLSGAAIWMVFQVNEGKKPNLAGAIKKVFPKYFILTAFLSTVFLIIYFISWGENLLVLKTLRFKFIGFLAKRGLLDFIMVFLNFFVITVVETFFAFVIPLAVLEGRRFFGSIKNSVALARKLFFATFMLVVIPALFSLPFSLLRTALPALMDRTLPEITLLVLGFSVATAVFIDAIVTVSLGFLFLSRKDLIVEKAK